MGKLLIGTQPVPDLLRTRYWGYPTVIGADEKGHNLLVARTVFTPVGEDVIGKSAISRLRVGAATIARNLLNPRFQSGKLRVRLFESGAQFEVGVQLYRDPVSTPLQLDVDKVWDVPEIPVARLTLRPQEQLPSLARAIEKNASFGPQHAENWETPRPDRIPNQAAGEFQTDRLVAYPASADERRAAKDGNVQLLRRVKTQK
jgi:hypothetical protein